MFLDLSEPHRGPDRTPSTWKMLRDLSGVRSFHWSRCRPEKCSWTYPGFTSALGRILWT